MKRFLLTGLACVLSSSVLASSFTVHHIQVDGLQRVSADTVLHAIPIHAGENYSDADGNRIISAIFKTGLFSNVQLSRSDNVLVVHVTELPTIDSVNITGNSEIKAKQLQPILKKLKIVPGDTFNPSELHAIVAGLQEQYEIMGYAHATVEPVVTPMSRNRVAIHIKINEGTALIVRHIHVSGNHAFSEHELLDQFKLTTPSIFTWFNHHDRYSSVQLDEDLESLQNFYLDHGYLNFKVVSKQVSHLPKGVSIEVTISEGDVYHLSEWHLTAVKMPAKLKPDVEKILSRLKPGMVFSRKAIIDTTKQVGDFLGDHGYAFPNVNPVPKLNAAQKTVSLDYEIDSGRRVYVRHIHILGDTRTSGLVIRSQLRQMESSLYSLKDMNESKRRIKNLGYLDNVTVTSEAVPNKNDQMDLTYHVHEVDAGRASVQAGYSDVEGLLYGANISEPNFMGTGKAVSLGFQRSDYSSSYSFSYTNPFYTTSGISRGFSVYYTRTTPGHVNIEPYTMDDFGTTLTYGIPVSEYNSWNLGGGYDHTDIGNVNPALVSPSVTQFMGNHPSPYNQFKLITGLTHGTLDRVIFPTSGNQQDIGLTGGIPILKTSLPYYEAQYDGTWYWPLFSGFILSPHTTLGYGNGYGDVHSLPFFESFYAGGLGTLPGYEPNTLGPKNPQNLTQGIGGNMEVLGGLNLFLPDFISSKVRTGILLDAGNIFQTHRISGINYESITPGNLRVTTGIMVSWWSPLGAPLNFSFAVPLNKKPGDQLDLFGFSFGAAI